MRRILVLALFVSMPASAQHLYRCIDYQGAVSIQDKPCPAAARETKRVELHAYEETATSRAARADAIERARASREAGGFKPAATAPSRRQASRSSPWAPDRNNQACENAKAHRKRTLEILGLKRTYDDLQRLDEGVRRACK